MDQFDEVYMMRHQPFVAGQEAGRHQAETYQFQDVINEAQQFGQEFGRQLAMYKSYVKIFNQMKIDQHLPNTKGVQLAEDITDIIKQIDYSSLQRIKGQRETLSKKFKIFSAMLGLKGTKQQLQHIKKIEGGFDF